MDQQSGRLGSRLGPKDAGLDEPRHHNTPALSEIPEPWPKFCRVGKTPKD